jgi:NAD(P)-dependent dehydrogenase (short-subunit alcohol dehydrogenase family)
MEISGKKAIVGRASGLGRATAQSLVARGASVAILDRAQSDGKVVAAAIGADFGEVDVADFAGTEQVLNQATEALGGMHVIVTTGGGGIGERTIKKDGPHGLDSFRAAIDLNLIRTFNISRHVSVSRCCRRGAASAGLVSPARPHAHGLGEALA